MILAGRRAMPGRARRAWQPPITASRVQSMRHDAVILIVALCTQYLGGVHTMD